MLRYVTPLLQSLLLLCVCASFSCVQAEDVVDDPEADKEKLINELMNEITNENPGSGQLGEDKASIEPAPQIQFSDDGSAEVLSTDLEPEVSPVSQGEDDDALSAKSVAEVYFKSLCTGEIEDLEYLADVPYSLDRKKVLYSLDDVKAVHEKILAIKGVRAVPKYTISRPMEFEKLNKKVFIGSYEVLRVNIEKDGS
ncbi:MAG: hypothetical protein HRU15_06925, partial [Planctomycetes bacterium]|nr:hypothetical protein [Planctomycetota bacterium]